MPDIHVKAVPVNGLFQFVAGELAPEQLRGVLEKLGPDARWFTGHLLAHEVVPLPVVNRFTEYSAEDRKSTRLNSSHLVISYAVFCLKKKKNIRYSHCVQIDGGHKVLICDYID